MNRLWIGAALASALLVSAVVYAKTVVTDYPSYEVAIKEACDGKQIGVQCSVTFTGGSVGIGICVEVPNSPVSGVLTCQLDVNTIGNCKNNALGTPSSWITFGSLAGLLLFMRRRRS